MTIQDAAFFGVAEALHSGGFPTDTAPWVATDVCPGAGQSAQFEKVLEDLIAAESWESLALRVQPGRLARQHCT